MGFIIVESRFKKLLMEWDEERIFIEKIDKAKGSVICHRVERWN